MIGQGLELMVYGMGTVLAFLALLVLATSLMSRVISRFFPEPLPEPAPEAAPEPQDPALLSAVAAAVHSYRAGKRGGGSRTGK